MRDNFGFMLLMTVAIGANSSQLDWQTYGFDIQRRGINPNELSISSSSAPNLSLKWSLKLNGPIVAQTVVALGYDIRIQNRLLNNKSFPTEFTAQDKFSPTLCPIYQGSQVQCSGCQYCPDGSMCSDCNTSHSLSISPSILPTLSPTIQSTTVTTSLRVDESTLCPVFQNTQVYCSGCQYCPDGSLCNNCNNNNHDNILNTPTSMPTIAYSKTPIAQPTNSPINMIPITTLPTTIPIQPVSSTPVSNTPVSGTPISTPTNIPLQPVSIPVSNTPVLCPLYQGGQVQCSGCQYCPDGSLCNNCNTQNNNGDNTSNNSNNKVTVTPVVSPSYTPTLATNTMSPSTNLKPIVTPSIPINNNLLMCTNNPSKSSYNIGYVGDDSGYFYAIDIDIGCILWSKYVGATKNDACADLPSFGVTGGATFDRSMNTVYVVGGDGKFNALSMSTGTIKYTLTIFDPTLLHNYGSLLLVNDMMYIPLGAICDIGNYKGGIVSISTVTQSVVNHFYPSNNFIGGGIWGLPGLTYGKSSIFTPTGNTVNGLEYGDYSEQIVELDADLRVLHTYLPSPGSFTDNDFGSSAIYINSIDELQSSGCLIPLMIASRKDGLYVVVNTVTHMIIQTLQLSNPNEDGFITTGAWDSSSNMLIVPTNEGHDSYVAGLIGFQLTSSCQLQYKWNTPLHNSMSNPTIVGPIGDRVAFVTGLTGISGVNIQTGNIVFTSSQQYASVNAPTIINGNILVSGFGSATLYSYGL